MQELMNRRSWMKAQIGSTCEGEVTTCFNFFILNQKIHTCLYSKQSYSDMSQYEKSPNPKFRFSLSMDLFQITSKITSSTSCWCWNLMKQQQPVGCLGLDAGQKAGPPKNFKTEPSQKNPKKPKAKKRCYYSQGSQYLQRSAFTLYRTALK